MSIVIYKVPTFTQDEQRIKFINMCSTFPQNIAYANSSGKGNVLYAVSDLDSAQNYIVKYGGIKIQESDFNKGMMYQWAGNRSLVPQEFLLP